MTSSYESMRGSLRTGDIVLFSGKGGLSTGIKHFTRCKWSHVGMVLALEEFDLHMLWESTTLSNIADAETGKELRGVQLVPLSERIRRYDGEVAIRRLIVDREPGMGLALAELRQEIKGRPYEENVLELVRSAYDGPFGANTEDLSSLFCSELVAEAYQRMGLLPESLPSNEYTPRDFSSKGELKLLLGSIGPEILIS